jgi:hypothetical protein
VEVTDRFSKKRAIMLYFIKKEEIGQLISRKLA